MVRALGGFVVAGLLLTLAADSSAATGREWALHEAAAKAELATVRELLAPREATGWRAWLQPPPLSVDARDERGRTALHFAAQSAAGGEASRLVVAALLSSGAAVDSVDNLGCTPLMLAAAIGSAQVCELLLENGADPNAATTGADEDFDLLETPLVAAAWHGHEAAVEVLLRGGAMTAAACERQHCFARGSGGWTDRCRAQACRARS